MLHLKVWGAGGVAVGWGFVAAHADTLGVGFIAMV